MTHSIHSQPFPAPEHDHDTCLDVLMEKAKIQCRDKGIRFTKLRENILRAIASSHCALGAYDIIEVLAKNGKRVSPISVYRILDTLIEAGLIHRLESRNAYFICHRTHSNTCRAVFLMCDSCGRVAETEGQTIAQALKTVADNARFKPHNAIIEIRGLCAHCA